MSLIARLRGVVEEISEGQLVVSVGGVGLLVHVSTGVQAIRGAALELYTELLVRENELTLYGFSGPDEQRLFRTLLTVGGVGPRAALALLSALGVDELAIAIANGDAGALAKAPGVGPKLANRIVLELRGKLAEAPAQLATRNSEAQAALMALGYTQAEAAEALARLDMPPDAALEERVRAALAYFLRG